RGKKRLLFSDFHPKCPPNVTFMSNHHPDANQFPARCQPIPSQMLKIFLTFPPTQKKWNPKKNENQNPKEKKMAFKPTLFCRKERWDMEQVTRLLDTLPP